MADGMEVELVVPGVDAAVSKLNQTAGAFQKVAAAQEQVERSSQKLARASGPNQRLVRAQEALHNALIHGGSRAEIADAQVALQRAQSALTPRAPKPPPPPRMPKEPPLARVSGPNQALSRALAAYSEANTPEEAADAQLAIQRARRQLNPPAKIPKPPPPVRVGGPHQALQRAMSALASASTPEQAADARLAIQRAQNQLKPPPPPPNFLQRLGQAVSSSRLNLGGVSPLVGKLANLLPGGGAAMAGPVGIAITASVAAIKALTEAAIQGGAALKELRDAASLTGGTVQQSATLRALGISAGSANSLRERIATDPMAMMGAARIGVRALPTLYGQQNNAQVAMQVLEGLQKVKAQGGDPLRVARMIGPEAEAMLPLLNMSERAKKSLMGTADALGEIAATQPASLAADMDAAWRKLDLAGEAFKVALFNIFGDDLTTVVNGLADALTGLASWMNDNKTAARAMLSALFPVLTIIQVVAEGIRIFGAGMDKLKTVLEESFNAMGKYREAAFQTAKLMAVTAATMGFGPVGGIAADNLFKSIEKSMNAGSASAQAQNANTAAIKQNTTALLKGQVYGGGARAQGAMPAGLTGKLLGQMINNNTHRMGYWTL